MQSPSKTSFNHKLATKSGSPIYAAYPVGTYIDYIHQSDCGCANYT